MPKDIRSNITADLDAGILAANVFNSVQEARLRFVQVISDAVTRLVDAGSWSDAIRLVVEQGGVSEADLARGLEVTRSTVNRWMNGHTAPQSRARGFMVTKIMELLRK